MGIRVDGSNDSITATDGSWSAEGLDLSAGLTVGTAVTIASNGNLAITGIITAAQFSGVDSDKISELNTQVECVDTGSDGHITFDTDGTEASRFDPSQRFLVGHTASEAMFYTGRIQVQGTSSSTSAITVKSNQNDSGGPAVVLGKSRGAIGSATVVQDGDELGSIHFTGADGTDTNSYAASISCNVNGTPGSDDMPGRLTFKTTADSAAAPTERLRIDASGRVLIGTTTEGESSADNLTVADSADCGITIRGGTSNNCSILFSDGTSGTGEYAGNIDYDHNGDYMRIFTAAAEKFRIDSSGHVLPGSDNAQDLGSYAKRWANVHSMDLNLSNEGAQNDVDGSWGSYTIQEGEDDLFLLNRRNGKKYKFNLTEV